MGLGWLPAIGLGAVTAVGGGAVRDIAVGRVPANFGGNTLYATCALAGSATLVVVQSLIGTDAGLVAGTVVGASLCVVARWRGWMLPEGVSWSRLPKPTLPLTARRRRVSTRRRPRSTSVRRWWIRIRGSRRSR